MSKIKEILTDYKGEFNPDAWKQFEKRLPKQSFMQKFGKWFAIGGSVVVLSVAALLVFSGDLLSDKTETPNPTVVEPSVVASAETPNFELADAESTPVVAAAEPMINVGESEKALTEVAASSEVDKSANVTETPEIAEANAQNNEIGEQNPSPKAVAKTKEPSFAYSCSSYCTPAVVRFEALNIDDSQEVVWNFGNGKQARGNVVTCEYQKKGSFVPVVEVYRNGNLEKSQSLSPITVSKSPEVDFNYSVRDNIYAFSPSVSVNASYKWTIDGKSFATKNAEYEFKKNGDYAVKLEVTDANSCHVVVTKNVKISISHVFYVPNAFTPNELGENSTFGPIGEDMNFKSFSFVVTSAKGETVFSTTSPDVQWNGRFNNSGAEVDADLYYWTIKTTDFYGNSQTKKGTVRLIR